MNAHAPAVVGYCDLLRDLRHLDARAASDLADWLAVSVWLREVRA